jgi:hypothetical protein
VIVFQVQQNGVAVPINPFGSGKTEMWDNFMGAPSATFVFAVPQDNVAAPTDFNARSRVPAEASGTARRPAPARDADRARRRRQLHR